MENNKWFGIPREEINWCPKIDYAKCISCMACVEKCSHAVYSKENGKPQVVNPKNCVVGCTGCDEICSQEAISHPPKEYLEKLIKHKDFKIGCNCGSNC